MIASLMMYARPELNDAIHAYWRGIRCQLAQRGIAAPAELSQNAGEFEVWEDPTLVLSQTCGMPYRTRLRHRVHLVGTPDYGLEGCPPGHYRSQIVVRAQDPREALTEYQDALMAFNMAHSQSGFAALYTHAQAAGFWFARRIQSGGHFASARMVAQGSADIAAIDAQTWRLIQRYAPWAAEVRVLESTAPTPGLPYITAAQHDPVAVYDAVLSAIDGLGDADRTLLDLKGLVRIPQAAYLAVPNPPPEALT